jgi:hypothetical protein
MKNDELPETSQYTICPVCGFKGNNLAEVKEHMFDMNMETKLAAKHLPVPSKKERVKTKK